MSAPDEFVRRWFEEVWNQTSPISVDVIKTVVEGRSVAAVCRVTGTHTGPGMGAPSGKKIDFSGIVDFPRMYQQIGWSP